MNIGIKETEEILEKIKEVKILLYGDFCLDAYWVLDPRGSEVSVETGLKALAAGNQKYSLGGASNVAANIAALKPKEIKIPPHFDVMTTNQNIYLCSKYSEPDNPKQLFRFFYFKKCS